MSDIITAARPTISGHWRADLLSSVHPETDLHVVCFYRDAAFLAENIYDIAGRILTRDSATVLMATSARAIHDFRNSCNPSPGC
jgi:hypothetical protein